LVWSMISTAALSAVGQMVRKGVPLIFMVCRFI
jgi:hypothetical protein